MDDISDHGIEPVESGGEPGQLACDRPADDAQPPRCDLLASLARRTRSTEGLLTADFSGDSGSFLALTEAQVARIVAEILAEEQAREERGTE